MGKRLSEMSLEELWRLFPIQLTPHQSRWAEQYQEEEARLLAVLGRDQVWRISHIGSTAAPGLWAKPIVDILLEAAPDACWAALKEALMESGYRWMSQSEGRMSFNRGYTEEGFAQQVFHLHLRRPGDCDELYFLEYLRKFPEAAKQYEDLKLGLWKQFEHNRDGYTAAKTELVEQYTQQARRLWPDRYQPERNR